MSYLNYELPLFPTPSAWALTEAGFNYFGTTKFYHDEKRFGEMEIDFTCGEPIAYPPSIHDDDWDRRYYRWCEIEEQEVYGNWGDITPRPDAGFPMS